MVRRQGMWVSDGRHEVWVCMEESSVYEAAYMSTVLRT